MTDILNIYRERSGDPGFWGEPCNALSNISFLIAAGFAFRLAHQRKCTDPLTLGLVVLAGTVGVGSFVFHTAAGPVTLWLDVIPIALFQVSFLWLAYHRFLELSALAASAVVITVLVASFLLMPVHDPLNGSLFYFPALTALIILGAQVSLKNQGEEPHLLLFAAVVFSLSISARSLDWKVSWNIGSHFLWHLLNGVVIYLGLRAWILTVSEKTSPLWD